MFINKGRGRHQLHGLCTLVTNSELPVCFIMEKIKAHVLDSRLEFSTSCPLCLPSVCTSLCLCFCVCLCVCVVWAVVSMCKWYLSVVCLSLTKGFALEQHRVTQEKNGIHPEIFRRDQVSESNWSQLTQRTNIIFCQPISINDCFQCLW